VAVSNDLPLKGRVCVVTGATSGIGFITARELARKGASVAAVGRDPARLSESVRQIAALSGNPEVRGFRADLFLQAEVRHLSTELLSAYPQVHVLVNNAGALFSQRATTSEGFERTWALNVVTPFLLTHLLLPRLLDNAPARVVNVSSMAHRGNHLDFEDLQGERHYSGYRAYGRSKLALLLLTFEFARRLGDTRVTVNGLHPGFVASRFGRNNPGGIGSAIHFFSILFGIRPERGARTSIFLASDPSVTDVTGKYFARQHVVASSPASNDTGAAARLWDVLSLQTGIPPDVLSKPISPP
jgi:NAD(P)-dependent dehydrogenase (short-subunit alcohol dehydrogenase family)